MHGNMNVNIWGCIHDTGTYAVTCQFLVAVYVYIARNWRSTQTSGPF